MFMLTILKNIALSNHRSTLAMELFSRRRWTTGSGQQSNNYGIMPCMCCIIFLGFNINTTAFCLGCYSLHILLLNALAYQHLFPWMFRPITGKINWAVDHDKWTLHDNFYNFSNLRCFALKKCLPLMGIEPEVATKLIIVFKAPLSFWILRWFAPGIHSVLQYSFLIEILESNRACECCHNFRICKFQQFNFMTQTKKNSKH